MSQDKKPTVPSRKKFSPPPARVVAKRCVGGACQVHANTPKK